MFKTRKEPTKYIYLPDFRPNNSEKETSLDDDVKMGKSRRRRLNDALTFITTHAQ